MSIDIDKIKPGDEVQVANGAWYLFIGWEDDDSDIAKMAMLDKDEMSYWPMPNGLLTDHRPAKPEPEPEEWVTYEDWDDEFGEQQADRNDINKLLTRKAAKGQLPNQKVHTCKCEPAEQFGLEGDSLVLWWDGECWFELLYADLDPGDHWMLQPPAPEGE